MRKAPVNFRERCLSGIWMVPFHRNNKFWSRALFGLLLIVLLIPAPTLRAQGFYWERIPVVHTLPSHIFSLLGLTHTTRLGYTRGTKQGVHDSDFPAGMTDIVPYDPMRLLIVRGTVDAVASFRVKIALLDVPQASWTVEMALLDAKSQSVLGSHTEPDVTLDEPEIVNITDGSELHAYRYRLYAAGPGQIAVVLRTGVITQTAANVPVFAPSIVWLDPTSKVVDLGTRALFNDTSAGRAAVRIGLGSTEKDSGVDYIVQVIVSPNTAPVSVAPPVSPEPVRPSGPGSVTVPSASPLPDSNKSSAQNDPGGTYKVPR